MRRIFSELIDLFKRHKIYLYLLCAILFFYASVFFLKKHVDLEPIVDHKVELYEQLLKEAPKNPEMIKQRLAARPGLQLMFQFFTFSFAGAFIYGVWLGIKDLRRLFAREALIPKSGTVIQVSWGVQEIARALILFFSLGIGLNLLFTGIKLFVPTAMESTQFLLVHTLILDTTFILFVAYLVKNSGSTLYDLLGFHVRNIPIEEIWWGLRTYFLIIPVFIGMLLLLVFLASLFAYEPPPHPLVEVLLEEEKLSPLTITFSLLIACVIGPAAEEVFFRGFFYPALKKYTGIAGATLVTTVLFAGVHENIFSFIPILFLGLVLCYLYEKRTNLLACMTLHMIHNTVFISYFFLVKSVLIE